MLENYLHENNLTMEEAGETTNVINIDAIACKLTIFFMVTGVVVNSLSIYIFLQKKLQKGKLNWYLLTLSVLELIFCLILSIDYIFNEIYIPKMFLHNLNNYTKIGIDFTIHTIDTYTIVLTLYLTVDRLHAFNKPLQLKNFITNLHAKSLIGFSFLVLLALEIPTYSFCVNKIIITTSSDTFPIMFCSLLLPIVFKIIPMVLIFIFNSILVVNLCKYYKTQSANTMNYIQLQRIKSNSFKFQHQYTVRTFSLGMSPTQKSHYFVIMATAIWSVLTSTPYYILRTYYVLFNLQVFTEVMDFQVDRTWQIISAIFFNANHCVNFFMYFAFHKDFRCCFIKLFFVDCRH